jgi:hypothetical protein
VVHRADKNGLLALLVSATPATLAIAASILLEEPFFPGVFWVLSLLLLVLLAIRLGIKLAFSALPSTASAAVPLRSVLRRLRLGLVLFCCHACTSWCVGIGYSVFSGGKPLLLSLSGMPGK